MNINTNKIGQFLQALNPAERKYINYTLDVSNALQNLIKDFDLPETEVCAHFEIKAADYQKFINGNWNYDTKQMSALNAIYYQLKTEALKDKAPVQVAGSKN